MWGPFRPYACTRATIRLYLLKDGGRKQCVCSAGQSALTLTPTELNPLIRFQPSLSKQAVQNLNDFLRKTYASNLRLGTTPVIQLKPPFSPQQQSVPTYLNTDLVQSMHSLLAWPSFLNTKTLQFKLPGATRRHGPMAS